MPRIKRHTIYGTAHLVIAKSIKETSLFTEENDYLHYLGNLKQMVRDKNLKLESFCLQANEIRMVIRPIRKSLSKIIQSLHCSHTARINKKLQRRGALFDGRFKSIAFANEHLMNVVRSIHLWPVRMGLVRRTESYLFSSHSAYVGNNSSFAEFINTKPLLQQIDSIKANAKRTFSIFVESASLDGDNYGIDEIYQGIGGDHKSSLILYNKIKQVKNQKPKITLQTLASRIALVLNIKPYKFMSPSRRQDLVMARRLFTTIAILSAKKNISAVALYLNRDKAQISRLLSQGLDLLDCSEVFFNLFETVRGKLPPPDHFIENSHNS